MFTVLYTFESSKPTCCLFCSVLTVSNFVGQPKKIISTTAATTTRSCRKDSMLWWNFWISPIESWRGQRGISWKHPNPCLFFEHWIVNRYIYIYIFNIYNIIRYIYIHMFTYYINIYIYMDISSQFFPVAYAGGWSVSWFFPTALTFSLVYISICFMILNCASYLFWLTSALPRFGVLPIGARIAPRWVKNMWLSVPWMFLLQMVWFLFNATGYVS